MGQIHMYRRQFRIKAHRTQEECLSFVQLSLLSADGASEVEGNCIVRLHLEGVVQFAVRLRKLIISDERGCTFDRGLWQTVLREGSQTGKQNHRQSKEQPAGERNRCFQLPATVAVVARRARRGLSGISLFHQKPHNSFFVTQALTLRAQTVLRYISGLLPGLSYRRNEFL